MKTWFLLLAVCFCCSGFALPIRDHQIDPTALSQLCLALNIPKESDIVAETQKRWLRKPGQERWEQTELSPEQKLLVLDWAEKQGFFASWKPFCEKYETALILGATTSRMQTRFDYLRELWDQGVRFNEIVWLTGERPLDPRVDGLTDQCSTEVEAARILWKEASLPEEMRALPVVFISAPMKVEGSLLKRPNTDDTILEWLKINPQPGMAVFVSDQPFCGYQFAALKIYLPPACQFDFVGKGIDSTSHPAAAAIILDAIARWIYQENVYQTTNAVREK